MGKAGGAMDVLQLWAKKNQLRHAKSRHVLTMSKRDQRPQGVEHQARRQQPINIEFPKILYCRHAALVCAIDILLQPSSNVFENLVHD